MADKLLGHWKLSRSENVDEYLLSLKYNFVFRNLNKITPYKLEITKEQDDWSIHMTSLVKNFSQKFQLGETFQEVGLDGLKMEVTNYMEEDKLISSRKPIRKEDKEVIMTYEVTDSDELMQTFTMVEKNIVSRRYLQRYTP